MNDFSDLEKIATCNLCYSIFECPVMLPCSEIICEKHIEQSKKTSENCDNINCHFCKEEHNIPKNGFPKDIRIAKLIEHKFYQMDFGKVHKKALDSCKELKDTINKMKNYTKEPQNYIEEYFNKIINEIDLFREENKLKIDQWHEKCFDEIQMYKNECLFNLKKDLTTETQNFEDFESDLQFWQEKLQIPELSNEEYSFQNIKSNVDSYCLTLAKSLEVLKNDLQLGHQYKLESPKTITIEDLPKIKFYKKVNIYQPFKLFLKLIKLLIFIRLRMVNYN